MASTINLLRLLADPTRLRLLLLIEQEELSVAELQQILGMGQSRISSHLAQLKRAGVVADRRVGKNVYYGANHNGQNAKRERVAEITRLLARELPEGSRDRTSLKLVLQKRQDKARKYFDELAGKFGRGYVPGRSWQALAHTLITLLPPLTVADLGAGEGTLSQLLAKRARKVIAVDNSPKMVEFGSQLAKKHGTRFGTSRHFRRSSPNTPKLKPRHNSCDFATLLPHDCFMDRFWSCRRLLRPRRQSGKLLQPNRNLAARGLSTGIWLWKTPLLVSE